MNSHTAAPHCSSGDVWEKCKTVNGRYQKAALLIVSDLIVT